MPHVINRHAYRSRARPDLPPLPVPALYIGRGTPLGNPNTRQDIPDTAKNLTAYRRHLWGLIVARDAKALEWLGRITEDTALVCSCAPRPCHGDVVVAAWRWWRENGKEGPRLGGAP